ncbi:MAG: sensor histidine kinase, partial [Steroidobacteraceae bacterium]
TLLLIVMAISALADAASYAAALAASGHLAADTLVTAIKIGWIGDINGIVTLLPLLLLARTSAGLQLWPAHGHLGELLLQLLALGAGFVITFSWAADVELPYFYLLFLPINWIALRWGVGVTALALVTLQAAIVTLLTFQPMPQYAVAIQLHMVVLAATALFMGITVSQNARFARSMQAKDAQLAKLDRLTAITEFNAAVAHELNNPLSALQNYLRAARLQIEQFADRSAIETSLDKALGESTRASAVLRRLRAYFRSGSVQKESADPRVAVSEAVAALDTRFMQEHIICTIEAAHGLPNIVVDRLQLSVVLHNLLSNACDAVRDSGAGRGRIVVAIREMGESMEFEVSDTGTGVPPSEVPQLFQPLQTSKPFGMGLGLAISRSLLEANGGRIWLGHSDERGTHIAFQVPVAGAAHAT